MSLEYQYNRPISPAPGTSGNNSLFPPTTGTQSLFDSSGGSNLLPRPGRRKIVYNPVELERAPLLTVVCGMKEVGKTYQTLKDIEKYI